MHILIIHFNLQGISQDEYEVLCDQLAPVYEDVPGLISKVWLADARSNTYGGVYAWHNPEAMQAYLKSPIVHRLMNHPNLVNVTVRDFDILEGPTQVTHGLAYALVQMSDVNK